MNRWTVLMTLFGAGAAFLAGCSAIYGFSEGKVVFTVNHPWWGAFIAALWAGGMCAWRAVEIQEGGCTGCAKKQADIDALRDALVKP